MNMHKDVKLISNLSGEKDIEIRSELVGSNSGGKRKSFWNVQIFDRSIIGALDGDVGQDLVEATGREVQDRCKLMGCK